MWTSHSLFWSFLSCLWWWSWSLENSNFPAMRGKILMSLKLDQNSKPRPWTSQPISRYWEMGTRPQEEAVSPLAHCLGLDALFLEQSHETIHPWLDMDTRGNVTGPLQQVVPSRGKRVEGESSPTLHGVQSLRGQLMERWDGGGRKGRQGRGSLWLKDICCGTRVEMTEIWRRALGETGVCGRYGWATGWEGIADSVAPPPSPALPSSLILEGLIQAWLLGGENS